MKAVKCPVCDGSGKYVKRREGWTTEKKEEKCHGCNGKGWVEVKEDRDTYHPWYPYNPYTPYDPTISPYPYGSC